MNDSIDVRPEHPERREAATLEARPVLAALAEILDTPGIKGALVSARSTVADFLWQVDSDGVPFELPVGMVVDALRDKLGVAVTADEPIILLARRLPRAKK